MKRATILSVLVIVACSTFAGTNRQKIAKDSLLIRASDIHEMFRQIIDVAGSGQSFELREAAVLNIEAKISHRKKYVLYNPAFIASLHNVTKDKWTVIALLAHEIGHHLTGHTARTGGSKPKLELEADEFAGLILYKLGATLRQSQKVMHFIAKEKGSGTHPGRNDRLIAIERGWNKGVALEASPSGSMAL